MSIKKFYTGVYVGDNLGVGTTSPSEKLEVAGNLKLNSGALIISGTPAGQGAQTRYISGVATTNDLWFNVPTAGRYRFAVADSQIVEITSAGNVGIGVTTPRAKLDVNGGVKVANDTDTASANKEGTLRYRLAPDVPKSQSMVDMCMKTGPSSYSWVNIVTNTWNN